MVAVEGHEVSGIRVVMADDHPRMRAMLRAALEDGGCDVCGEGAVCVHHCVSRGTFGACLAYGPDLCEAGS